MARGLTEPDGGSDLLAGSLTATRHGSDSDSGSGWGWGLWPVACGHLGRAERDFDYAPPAGEHGVKGITGVERAVLNLVSL